MPRVNRFRRAAGVLTIALCLVAVSTVDATARWAVHDGGTVTDVRVPPGGGDFDVCADQIHGLAGYAEAIGSGADPDDFPIPPSALTPTSYQVFVGPPGSDLFVNQDLAGNPIGYTDGNGDFQEAALAAAFTSPARRAADPITLGPDWYVFTTAPYSAPLAGVQPGDTVGVKPHPNSPLATVADWTAVDCGDRGFLRWWERDVDFCPQSAARLLTGDVTGDRRSDLVCNNRASGDLWIASAQSGGAFGTTFWRGKTDLCRKSGSRLLLADVNGNGRADLVCQDRTTGRIAVALSRAGGRFVKTDWRGRLGLCRAAGTQLLAGDVNGDSRADLVCHDPKTGAKAVAQAKGAGTFPKVNWTGKPKFCRGGQVRIGDLNGDGRDDLLCHNESSGANAVALARKGGTFVKTDWRGPLTGCGSAYDVSLGDVDRNGREDLICRNPATGYLRIALARSGGKLPKVDFGRNLGFCTGASGRLRVGDASGDRRADLVCARSGSGIVSASYSDL